MDSGRDSMLRFWAMQAAFLSADSKVFNEAKA